MKNKIYLILILLVFILILSACAVNVASIGGSSYAIVGGSYNAKDPITNEELEITSSIFSSYLSIDFNNGESLSLRPPVNIWSGKSSFKKGINDVTAMYRGHQYNNVKLNILDVDNDVYGYAHFIKFKCNIVLKDKDKTLFIFSADNLTIQYEAGINEGETTP